MSRVRVAVAVMAKAPVAGRVKTRMCPPCTDEEAARIAEALLGDALAVVGSIHRVRPIVLLDGRAGTWLPQGFEVLPQRGGPLVERLVAGFEDLGAPALIVAMDSPDMSVDDVRAGVGALAAGADAVVGPAEDGGYWAIGLRRPQTEAIAGVPMSRPDTLAHQRRRLDALGLRLVELRTLPDVDTFADAVAASVRRPGSALADEVASVQRRLSAEPSARRSRR